MGNKKQVVLLILTAIALFGGLYATTYIPKKIVTIEPSEVSKIEIFDGNQGEMITLDDAEHKENIILNLNDITFSKGKLSLGYSGYRFRVTIYDNTGKEYKELIINSDEKIRYNGFFYTVKSSSIDYDYIEHLFNG